MSCVGYIPPSLRKADAPACGNLFPLGLAQGFDAEELRLLEAPEEVLEALEQGQDLRVVGESRRQPAALCTDRATFELCRVETSNMLLLVPPLKADAVGASVVGNVSYHYEVRWTAVISFRRPRQGTTK